MYICDANFCTGCLACVNICKKKAIRIEENKKGFLYPVVDNSKCISCGLCYNVCPVNKVSLGYDNGEVYAALAKDDQERAKSTSGGIFALLAKKVIKSTGYVYGAVLSDNFVVCHSEAHTLEQMERMRGSKYVQSYVGNTYEQAKKRLDEGAEVLFSGTPCQIAALRNFLGKNYSNLLTIDVLCHGIPSPGVFKKYIEAEEKRIDSKLIDIKFRSKKTGWKKLHTERISEKGRVEHADTFVPGFLSDLFLRESCYKCPYANKMRQGDITLGDYWGYRETKPEYIEDDDKGISLVIVNTTQGKKAFRSIKRKIAYTKRTIDNAVLKNPILIRPNKKPDNYDDFWSDYQNMKWYDLCDKYMFEQNTEEWMDKSRREYFDIPFIHRHRKHWIKRYRKEISRNIRKMLGVYK